MSLFQCDVCGSVENTGLAAQGIGKLAADWFMWTGIEERKGLMLCSACAPPKYADGSPTGLGEWHKKFNRVFLPCLLYTSPSPRDS